MSESESAAAREAMRLIETVQDWLHASTDGHVATGSEECCVCPVCRVIAVVRDTDPALVGTLTQNAVGLLDTVRGLVGMAGGERGPAGPGRAEGATDAEDDDDGAGTTADSLMSDAHDSDRGAETALPVQPTHGGPRRVQHIDVN